MTTDNARRIEFRCNTCGGGNVRSDAWAEWDVERQEWSLAQTFDDMHCEDCEGECSCTDVGIDSVDEIKAFFEELVPDIGKDVALDDFHVDDLRDHLAVLENKV